MNKFKYWTTAKMWVKIRSNKIKIGVLSKYVKYAIN